MHAAKKGGRQISVVIPAYNEEKRLPRTLEAIVSYLKKKDYRYEVIIVDDGSSDHTAMVAARSGLDGIRILKNGVNRGKGFSVRRGMLQARYPDVLFTDADLSTPIEELDRLSAHLKAFDIVIGSRNMKGSDIEIKQPFLRSALGNVFPFLVSLLVIKGIQDTQCGFKLMTRTAVREIMPSLKIEGFAFDVELLYLAKKKGYRIKEVPVRWKNDTQSKVSVLSDPARMFFNLLRIRFFS